MVSGPTNDPEVFSEISGVNLLIEEPGSLSAPNSFASREDESELTNSLHQFWEIESMGTKEEQIAKEEFLQDIQYQESEGQYEVNLPWKTYCTPKSDSYVICVKRLRQLWSRLKNDKWVIGGIRQNNQGTRENGYRSCSRVCRNQPFSTSPWMSLHPRRSFKFDG